MPANKRVTKIAPHTFEVPVSPLVLAFLKYHYTIAPFTVRGGEQDFNPYSVFLNSQLERYQFIDTVLPKGYNLLTSTLTLSISQTRGCYSQGYHLSAQKIWAFNEFCKNSFMQMMVSEVSIRRQYNENVEQAIEIFLTRYGIDDDILRLDTAARYFRRLIARRAAQLN